jgi:hypothetical protein
MIRKSVKRFSEKIMPKTSYGALGRGPHWARSASRCSSDNTVTA